MKEFLLQTRGVVVISNLPSALTAQYITTQKVKNLMRTKNVFGFLNVKYVVTRKRLKSKKSYTLKFAQVKNQIRALVFTLLDNYKIKTQFLNFKMMNPHTFGYNRKISTVNVRVSK